jgi:anti-sigma regulatory factor (Ser/Thr protein kinase)
VKLQVELPPKPEVAGLARKLLAVLLADVPEDLRDDVCLLTDELISNSLRHAHLARTDRIRLLARLEPSRVFVQVCDPGANGFPSLRIPEPDDTHGRGLYLLDALAREWGVRREDNTCVWFEMPLGKAKVKTA